MAEGFSAVLLETVRGDRPEYPDGTFEAMAQALAQMQECGRQLRGLAGKRTETPMQQAVTALLTERCRAAEGMLEKTERLDEKTEAFFRGFSMLNVILYLKNEVRPWQLRMMQTEERLQSTRKKIMIKSC